MMAEHAPGFLKRLRAETAAAHASIEQIPALARLTSPDITPEHLVALLRRMYAFHAALQAPLAAALAAIPACVAFQDAARLTDLMDDLAFFGHHPGPCPLIYAPPCLRSSAHALGYLYVVEGASLGGRVIARHLEDNLGVTAAGGARFFAGRSAVETRGRFQLLAAMLEREADFSPAAAAAIVDGAIDGFGTFATWMTIPAEPWQGTALA